ncbi:DUF3095 domain-containing protein [Arcobacter sp. s6]|uniref:DUF3095 domain-containing protein n=1 Tax=Arcobacter sp. s6 TaxID=3230363 RepID=UPI0034A06A1F
MSSNDFYKNLKEITDFSKIMENSNYSKIPNDWYILVSDIKDSTKSIEQGMYKQVNFIAALTIIGILNINRDEEFPYIFGGDGASLLIPPSLLEKSKKVLLETSKRAKEAFDLELRVAAISVKTIEEKGSFIELTKLKVDSNIQAIVRGNGLELAEELLKNEYEKYKIEDSFKNDYTANFEGLECRWEDIKTPKDETISILIKSINQENDNIVYTNCIKIIEEIAGIHSDRNPLKTKNQLHLSFNPRVLNTEASIFSKNIISKFFTISRLMIENFLGLILMKYSIGNWGEYKNIILKTTDTEKFDDMLRMVISTNTNQSIELEKYLEKEYQNKNLVYGIHKSNSALMTCLIFQRHGKHIHFVDSSKGGYALAAKELKNRIKFI